MIRVKASLDHKRIRCLIWLVLTVFVLLGYSLQSVAGSAYYSMVMQNYATVSSPPVILQNGTAGTSTIYANNTSAKVSVEAPVYLDGWDERVKITIDHNDIDSTLSNFPVLVYLSNSSGRNNDDVTFVFDELQNDTNRKKIAVTTSDGTTQCYVEIEKWDDASEQAWLWVKVPSVNSTVDTDLYLYYDADQADNTDYVDDTNTGNSVNVWDSNFKMVQHMRDNTTSSIVDSTSNDNDGTKGAANQPIEVDAKIGKGQDFTPTANYIEVGTTGFSPSSGTVEAWGKAEGFSGGPEANYLFGHTTQPPWANRTQLYTDDLNGTLDLGLGDSHTRHTNIQDLDPNTWYHVVLTWNGTNYVVYVDSVSKASGTYSGLTSIYSLADIGNTGDPAARVEAWNGTIDEVRVSDVSRSAAWVNASYESGRDDLLDFGSEESWLSGWDKRVKITIDHNDIDSTLSNFPVLVYLSNSSGRNNDDVTFVLDEVGSNSKKIAVTTSDGTTECYVEIEKWDDASEQAWLWVKVPSISSTSDTDLYLYFDNDHANNTDYVGDPNSTPAENVWDTNFKGVWHMTEVNATDSTSNNNDGTESGGVTYTDSGKIDGADDFDGNDDYIQTTSNELKTLDNFTLSVWFKADSTTTPSHHILWEGPASQNGWGDGTGNPNTHEMHLTICKFDANNTLNFFYGYEESGGDWVPAVEINMSFSDTTNWNHVVVVMTGAGTSPSAELFLNGVSQGTDTGTQTNRTAWDTNLRIGRPGANERYFDGVVDEVRISNTTRSAAWIKASNESGRDDLLDFGSEESASTSWLGGAGGQSVEDYVDNNTSDVDSSADKGTHSNFAAQQAGPDSVYDTLTEENTVAGEGGAAEDYVDNNTSDVDSSTDLGSHSNFENQKDKDSIYDALTEENTGGTGTDVEDYVDATSDIDSSPDIGSHSNFENQKAKDATYDTLMEETVAGGGDWGITETLPSSANVAPYRYMGGISPDIEGMNITKIHIYCSTAGTMAVGVWTGGSLSNATGAVKRTEAYNVSVVAGWNEIDVPDYSWPANTVTWIGWTCDGTVQVYASSSSSDSGDFQSANGRWSQTNPATADPTQPMNSTIGDGSFANWWYVMYLEYDSPDSYQLDLEVQFTGLDFDEINEELCIYTGSTDAENITVDYWTGSGWSNLLTDLAPNTWNNVSVSLTSATFTIRFMDETPNGDTNQDSWQIDATLVHVWGNPQNWELDLEVQFTDFVDFLATEKLYIYTGTLGVEDLNVDFWNGTGWENIATDLTANSWNNYTVSLTSPTFTIRFKDGTNVGDTATQDQWQIDATLLRVEGAGSKEDAVDQQSDVDGSADVGTHGNFTAQQYGPDSIYDALTEENTGGTGTDVEDYVDATSDIDSSPDIGSHSNFENQKAKDTTYDTLTEASVVVGGNWGLDRSDGTGTAIAEYRYMGGTSPNIANMNITKLHYYAGVAGQIAIGVWEGGILTNPVGASKILQALNVTVAVGWNEIDVTDTSWSANTVSWIGWTNGGTGSQSAYVQTGDLGDFAGVAGRWSQTNPAAADVTQDMNDTIQAGSFSPYWYCMYIEYTAPDSYQLDLEVQFTGLDYDEINEELCIYTGSTDAENITVDYWTGSGWSNLLTDLAPNTWNNVSVSLTSATFTIRFMDETPNGDTNQDSWQIDACLVHVWGNPQNWELDLEVQFTGVVDFLATEKLCIYTGTLGVEDLNVDFWNGTGWENIATDLTANSWNNYTVSLTSQTFTIRFKGGTETGDASQDTWQIDVALIHVSNEGGGITFYAQTGATDTDATVSWTHTVGTGSNRLLVVGVAFEHDTTPYPSVSDVKYNGVDLTKIADQDGVAPGSNYTAHASLWYMLNPPSGTHNINVTVSAAPLRAVICYGSSYEGVKQSAPDDYDTNNVTLGDISVTLTAAADGSVAVFVGACGNEGTYTALTDCEIRDQQNASTSESGCIGDAMDISSGDKEVGASHNNINRATIVAAIWQPEYNYELDLEVQWTSASYNQTSEELCIKTGTTGTEDIKVDVWNGSEWITVFSDLTPNNWNNVSVSSYLNSSTFTIRFNGGNEIGDPNQDSWNIDATLLHIWTSEGTYDYVLRVNNTGTESWQIRLKEYSDSNISRLQSCTIYFHNSTDGTSSQIIIENGAYINQTGPWYDLGDSETIYIAMTVQANSTATSYVYTYLEIRTPNTTTYAQYVITFEIT